MKKSLFNVLVITCAIVGFSGQSWAFGSRHHGGGSSIAGSSSGGGNNGGTIAADNSGTNVGSGSNTSNTSNVSDTNTNGPSFPVAPVPEPMTLTLLGTGLAGLVLRRKMKQQ